MSYGRLRPLLGQRPVDPRRVSTAMKKASVSVKARAGRKCEVCGALELFHRSRTGRRMSNLILGHKVPLERYEGSPTDKDNLWALCRSCNASQGNRTVEEWQAAKSGRLVELAGRGALVRGYGPTRHAFRYHVHRTRPGSEMMVGYMSTDWTWPGDGTCPPECPLPKHPAGGN